MFASPSMPVEFDLQRWLASSGASDLEESVASSSKSDAGSNVSDVGVRRAVFLDVRSEKAFEERRLEHSANVPLGSLDRNGHVLPPRSTPFVLIADPESCDDVCAQLERFSGDFKGVSWNVTAAFAGDDSFFDACAESGKTLLKVSSGRVDARDRLRLWDPSPELYRWLPQVERALGAVAGETSGATCVDLGSGAGRDAVWAASRGWHVIAIDNDAKGLDRCAALAERHGVSSMVTTLKLDLTKTSSDDVFSAISAVHSGKVSVVYAVRYLHKPLVRDLSHLMPPKSAVLWFHFMRGCENTSVGRPTKDRDLLESSELRDAFDSWTLLVDNVVQLPDGRPVSEFAALKE